MIKGGGHWYALLFVFSFFLYSFILSFFSIVTFLGWTWLHATWIKPEVVATKKYTGYLHYRFITTGSRFLWSPCCSYRCFFEFLCVPANCLSVYDIVFPMFWTFLWWVNGRFLAPYYTCYSVNFQRNKAFVGLSDCRTIGPSDCRTIGLSDYRSDPGPMMHSLDWPILQEW